MRVSPHSGKGSGSPGHPSRHEARPGRDCPTTKGGPGGEPIGPCPGSNQVRGPDRTKKSQKSAERCSDHTFTVALRAPGGWKRKGDLDWQEIKQALGQTRAVMSEF